MIHIILDTSIYRNNPSRDNLSFKAIEKLLDAKWATLHIPYVVEREFQTQQRKIYENDLKKVVSGLSGLARKQLSPDISIKIESLKKEIDNESENILSDAEYQFVKWAEDIGANRFALCLEQATVALEAYFQGKPPLKMVKNREDIPDSLIVQAIKKIHSTNTDTHVVAEDKKIREAFSNIDSIFTYRSLAEFVESEIVQNELKDLDFLDNLKEIGEAIKGFEKEYHEISETISDEIGEKLVGTTIHDSSIPDDNNEAVITTYYTPERIELDFENLAYYGNGHIGIPFSLYIEVDAFFYIFKSEYFSMDLSIEHRPSVTDHNDHYFEAEDNFELLVEAVFSLKIDRENINLDKISESIFSYSLSVDDIENITVITGQE